MNQNVDVRGRSTISTDGTVIQCLQCISEGEIIKYEPSLKIQVVNISIEGLCISTEKVFKKGTVLEFNIALGDTLYESILATIIWSIKNENIYKYGLHIKNITGQFNNHIYEMKSGFSTSI